MVGLHFANVVNFAQTIGSFRAQQHGAGYLGRPTRAECRGSMLAHTAPKDNIVRVELPAD
jgi:hypothetical protein